MTQQVLAKEDFRNCSRKNSSHRVTQGTLTESHTAVFRCELCEKLCETLRETLSLTQNASHIKRTRYKTVIGNLFQHLRKHVAQARLYSHEDPETSSG